MADARQSTHNPDMLARLAAQGWAPEMRPGRGSYTGKCTNCGGNWVGVKHCRVCESCAVALVEIEDWE